MSESETEVERDAPESAEDGGSGGGSRPWLVLALVALVAVVVVTALYLRRDDGGLEAPF